MPGIFMCLALVFISNQSNMKTIQSSIILLLFSFTTFAQSISITDNTNACYIGPDVVTLSGNDGGSPQRNIYTGTANNGSFPMRIIWNVNQWEIQLDTGGNGSYETPTHGNSFASYPNPPALGTGTWSDLTGGICAAINKFDGSGTQTVLPVELTFFTGKLEEHNIVLRWQTATETNNDKFEIEISQDGQIFDKISEVNVNGTTLEMQNYRLIIEGLNQGIHYFRLKQIDFDGQFSYSEIIETEVQNSNKSSSIEIGSLYPNPSRTGLINLDYTANEEELNMIVYDLTGEIIFHHNALVHVGKHQLSYDLSFLEKGLYFVHLTNSVSSTIQKIVIH